MDFIQYAERFGACDFAEKPFNNVDAAIFVMLSYLSWEKIAPTIYEGLNDARSFAHVSDDDIKKMLNCSSLSEKAAEVFSCIRKTARYRDVSAGCVMNILDGEVLEQFFAVTFHIPSVCSFISYRGTDSTMIGWRENVSIITKNVMVANLDGVEYLHQVVPAVSEKNDVPVFIGGHSKGGNISCYTYLHSPKVIRDMIEKVYSFDGLGFFNKDFMNIECYGEFLKKFIQILPEASVVGAMLYTPEKRILVKADVKGVKQHTVFFWSIGDDGDFIYLKKRSLSSKILHRGIKYWAGKNLAEDVAFFAYTLLDRFVKEEKNENGSCEEIKRKKPGIKEKLKFFRISVSFWMSICKSALYYSHIHAAAMLLKRKK